MMKGAKGAGEAERRGGGEDPSFPCGDKDISMENIVCPKRVHH